MFFKLFFFLSKKVLIFLASLLKGPKKKNFAQGPTFYRDGPGCCIQRLSRLTEHGSAAAQHNQL